MTEDHVPAPNAECPYAWHKLESERLCHEAGPCSILRLAAILGPHADPRIKRATRGYRVAVPAFAGVPMAMQFLHEDDAAVGLLQAGLARASGVWNLATADWLSASEVAAVSGG